MSRIGYIKNPNIVRIVKYCFTLNGKEMHSEHICYEKSDEEAINSAYKNCIWAWHESFRIEQVILNVT